MSEPSKPRARPKPKSKPQAPLKPLPQPPPRIQRQYQFLSWSPAEIMRGGTTFEMGGPALPPAEVSVEWQAGLTRKREKERYVASFLKLRSPSNLFTDHDVGVLKRDDQGLSDHSLTYPLPLPLVRVQTPRSSSHNHLYIPVNHLPITWPTLLSKVNHHSTTPTTPLLPNMNITKPQEVVLQPQQQVDMPFPRLSSTITLRTECTRRISLFSLPRHWVDITIRRYRSITRLRLIDGVNLRLHLRNWWMILLYRGRRGSGKL
jgi:hypothetical protein